MPASSKNQPYSVTYHDGNYYFHTDHGMAYSVGFANITHDLSPLLGIYDIEVYDIELRALDLEREKRKPQDPYSNCEVLKASQLSGHRYVARCARQVEALV